MTLEEKWRAAARAVTVPGSIPVLFSINRRKNGAYYAVGEMLVPDSEQPAIIATKVKITGEEMIDIGSEPDFHVFWHIARNLYLHELEEQISVNSVRALDPHKTKTRGIKVNSTNWYVTD